MPCSVSCDDLKHRAYQFTGSGSTRINDDLKGTGLSAVKVTNTYMSNLTDRLKAIFFDNKWCLAVMALLGGLALSATVGLFLYRKWLDGDHKSNDAGNYVEMEED